MAVDYNKLIKPAKSNFNSELEKNKKLQGYKTPTGGRVVSVTPLAARQNEQLVKNQGYVSQLGSGATESILNQHDIENANINVHNQNVDRKVLAEEQARRAAEAQAKLDAAKWGINASGGNPGGGFSMDGIGGGGFNPDANLTGMQYSDPRGNKGKLGSDQAANIKQAIAVADRRGASAYEKQIMVATIMAESGGRNLMGGDRDSAGLFQQRPSQGWGSLKQVTDIEYSTNKFLNALKPNLGGGSGWMDAQQTQRSAYSDGSNYKVYWGFAEQVVAKTQANPIGASVASNKKLDAWLNSKNGKYLDYDNAYGQQCVDLFRYYLQYKGVSQVPSMGRSGGAKELFENPTQVQAMRQRGFKQIGKNSNGMKGDIAVFGAGLGAGFGHVGVIVGDNGNGTVRIMGSNSSTVGNGKPTNITNISKKHLLGYWR